MTALRASQVEKVYRFSVAGLLFLTGVAKLVSSVVAVDAFSNSDPVFDIPRALVWIFVGLMEFGVGVYLVRGEDHKVGHGMIVWLATLFFAYRVTKMGIVPSEPCFCLGRVAERLPVKQETWDSATTWALVYMFLGSGLFLFSSLVTRVTARMSDRARQWLKNIPAAIAVAALLPGVQAGCVAATKPFTTGPILLRSTKSILAGPAQPAAQFIWTDLNRVPPDFLKAVLAAEDRHFFEHGGFDWQEIRRSILTSVERGDRLRGASTISQQCARSLFLWQGRSWIRKGLEAYYTLWMELLLSKRRILELYVNVIELGDGIYGVEAAARHYYNKSARDLTREEAAMLAAILPAPKRWNPLQPTDFVKKRQEAILRSMAEVQLPWEEVSESNQIRAAAPAADARVEKPEQKSDAATASSGSPESVR
jgi:monofunctional biosynthetic peptidoglycan transglycosylase